MLKINHIIMSWFDFLNTKTINIVTRLKISLALSPKLLFKFIEVGIENYFCFFDLRPKI